jgi:hypothetical protein
MMAVGNSLLYYAVKDQLFVATSAGGVDTLVGTLSGTQKVFFARNNAATPDLMVVTEHGAFTFTPTTITSYSPAGFVTPNSVTFLDGYFIFSAGSGLMQASGLNSMTFNTLDVTKAEAKPDGMLRVVAFGDQIFAFGTLSTEVYTNTANPVGFPMTRSFVMPRGLLSSAAVAGQEDGFGSALIWVADDSTVVRFNGSGVEKISPPDLDRLILAAVDKSKIEASVYVVDGHAKWVLSSVDWTWEFDLNTQKWNERRSYMSDRWMASQSVYAFNKWIVGQTDGPLMLSIDSINYTEARIDPATTTGATISQPLLYRLESGPVEKFPARMRVAEAYFNMSVGVGYVTGVVPLINPLLQVYWSDDGGVSWNGPAPRPMGPVGETKTTISVLRTGATKRVGRRWRLDVTDAVYVGVLGGDMLLELRAA